jgi:hypothetical protein
VVQAKHKATGYLLCVKIYDKVKLSKNQTQKKSVMREINILKKLDFKIVPVLYDVIDSPS